MKHQNHHPQRHQQAAQNIFMSSVQGLSNVLAAVVTFFATPILYNASAPWVHEFTRGQYGADMADFTLFVWFFVSGALVFFTARASLSTLFVVGGMALATRLF